MSNERVRTRICTPSGELEFQTYFVKRRARDRVTAMRFEGASEAAPAPGLLDAIAKAEAIILCPSNPFISIGPILAIPGIREALQRKREKVAAISPIVGGRALKGPAAKMMKSMQVEPSAAEVAKLYRGFLRRVRSGRSGSQAGRASAALDMRPVVTNTIMRGLRERKALARVVARELGIRIVIFAILPGEEPAKRQAALERISCRGTAGNAGAHALPADVGRAVPGRRNRPRGGRHQRCRDRRSRAACAGALVFEEDEQVSHSVSADAACLRAMEMGASTVLLVPIDVPTVTPADFSAAGRFRTPRPDRCSVLRWHRHQRAGAHAAQLHPEPLRPGSFRAHLDQALSQGLPADVLRLPGLMFDIDTPEDVAEFLARPRECSRFRRSCDPHAPRNRSASPVYPRVRPGDDLAA